MLQQKIDEMEAEIVEMRKAIKTLLGWRDVHGGSFSMCEIPTQIEWLLEESVDWPTTVMDDKHHADD